MQTTSRNALACGHLKDISKNRPYFATSDQAGSYKIENVPDGSYTVTAWHEGAKTQSKPVVASGDAKTDFTLSK